MTNAPHFPTTAAAVAHFEAQGALDPGTEGFWKVWGARVANIRPGDLVLFKVGEEIHEVLIRDTFLSKSDPIRKGFVDDEGQFTFGALIPVIVLRWDTHNILA